MSIFIRVLVLNYLLDQLLLGFCFILTPVTSIIIKKTFDFPNAVAAAPPQRWPPRHETRNPHNSCIHHPNVMKRNTHVRHGRTVNNIWFSEVGVAKQNAIKHETLITPAYIIQTSCNFIHTSGTVKQRIVSGFQEWAWPNRSGRGLKFPPPSPTLAYANEIRYARRVHQDARKSLSDELPASDRKSAVLTARRKRHETSHARPAR